jgi:hypothetical protein
MKRIATLDFYDIDSEIIDFLVHIAKTNNPKIPIEEVPQTEIKDVLRTIINIYRYHTEL